MSVITRELVPVAELDPSVPHWHAVLHPGAAEATIIRRCTGSSSGICSSRSDSPSAVRRAKGKVRRFVVSNRLNQFVTLTFAQPCTSREEVQRVVTAFLRTLRADVGRPFPWLLVIESHSSGALHAHLLLRGIDRRTITAAWRQGHVDVRRVRTREDRRGVAAYLAKDFAATVEPGRHRYECAQGFAPVAIRIQSNDEMQLLSQLIDLMEGTAPVSVWASEDWEHWQGPPLRVLWWP